MKPLPRMPMRKSFRRGREGWMFRSISTHGHERNALAFVVASDSLCPGIESEDTVHQEGIAMMAVFELNAQQPGTIGHMLHRIGLWVPLVEIANEADGL